MNKAYTIQLSRPVIFASVVVLIIFLCLQLITAAVIHQVILLILIAINLGCLVVQWRYYNEPLQLFYLLSYFWALHLLLLYVAHTFTGLVLDCIALLLFLLWLDLLTTCVMDMRVEPVGDYIYASEEWQLFIVRLMTSLLLLYLMLAFIFQQSPEYIWLGLIGLVFNYYFCLGWYTRLAAVAMVLFLLVEALLQDVAVINLANFLLSVGLTIVLGMKPQMISMDQTFKQGFRKFKQIDV